MRSPSNMFPPYVNKSHFSLLGNTFTFQVFDNYSVTTNVDGCMIQLGLWGILSLFLSLSLSIFLSLLSLSPALC